MKSQTPTWAIIVAILMMLIGGCGIKNDIQYINIRSMLSIKDEIFNKFDKKVEKSSDENADTSIETSEPITLSPDSLSDNEDEELMLTDSLISDTFVSDTNSEPEEIKEVKDMLDGFLNIPEETIQWMIRLGYIGLVFSILFLVGGLFLLIKKKFSIPLAYAVLAANVVFSIFKWIMLSGKGGSLLTISNSIGAAFSIIICIIVGVVIISCDKSYYEDVYTD